MILKSKILLLFVSLILLTSCSKKKQEHTTPPRPVQTATAIKKDVPIYIDTFGTCKAFKNVNIQSQITGQIQEINFKDGDYVSIGDLLITIDPKEYEAELLKAKAALSGNEVDLQLKKDTVERNKTLFEQNLISKQEFEQYQTELAAAQSQVELDKANFELAQINLDYCYICSPIDGLAGKNLLDEGNIVTANQGPTLANIKTIDPLFLDFTVPEKDLPTIREAMSKAELKIEIYVENDPNSPYSGGLQFINNIVDDSTGTIYLRGLIPNKNKTLWAGQFVKVKLILGTKKDAVLVPYEAAQLGQKGEYLFIVTPDNKADLKQVTLGQRDGNNIVIETGIKTGDIVVTVGQMGLSPGVTVQDITTQKQQQTNKNK